MQLDFGMLDATAKTELLHDMYDALKGLGTIVRPFAEMASRSKGSGSVYAQEWDAAVDKWTNAIKKAEGYGVKMA